MTAQARFAVALLCLQQSLVMRCGTLCLLTHFNLHGWHCVEGQPHLALTVLPIRDAAGHAWEFEFSSDQQGAIWYRLDKAWAKVDVPAEAGQAWCTARGFNPLKPCVVAIASTLSQHERNIAAPQANASRAPGNDALPQNAQAREKVQEFAIQARLADGHGRWKHIARTQHISAASQVELCVRMYTAIAGLGHITTDDKPLVCRVVGVFDEGTEEWRPVLTLDDVKGSTAKLRMTVAAARRDFEIQPRLADGHGRWKRIAGTQHISAASLEELCARLCTAIAGLSHITTDDRGRVVGVFDEDTEEWRPVLTLDDITSSAKLRLACFTGKWTKEEQMDSGKIPSAGVDKRTPSQSHTRPDTAVLAEESALNVSIPFNVYYVTNHHSVGANFEQCIRLAASAMNITLNLTSCNLGPMREGNLSCVAALCLWLSCGCL